MRKYLHFLYDLEWKEAKDTINKIVLSLEFLYYIMLCTAVYLKLLRSICKRKQLLKYLVPVLLGLLVATQKKQTRGTNEFYSAFHWLCWMFQFPYIFKWKTLILLVLIKTELEYFISSRVWGFVDKWTGYWTFPTPLCHVMEFDVFCWTLVLS